MNLAWFSANVVSVETNEKKVEMPKKNTNKDLRPILSDYFL
jgi:hypothetical protein